LAFRTPLLLGISNDPPWWDYGYFLEGHITSRHNGECISGKMGGIIGRGRLRMEQG